MIFLAVASIAVMFVVYRTAERRADAYLTELRKQTPVDLPNRRAFPFGENRYQRARDKVLRAPVADPDLERLRRPALRWSRYWPLVVGVSVVPLAYVAAALQRAGIGVLDQSGYDDLTTGIQVVTVIGLAMLIIRLVWRFLRRERR